VLDNTSLNISSLSTSTTNLETPATITIDSKAITTSGAQTYNSAVILGTNVSLSSTAGAISLASVMGNYSLSSNAVNGTNLKGIVNVAALALSGATTYDTLTTGTITTSGGQTYNDSVTLGSSIVTLTNTSTVSSIVFEGSGNALNLAS